jgi:hypothetical protein
VKCNPNNCRSVERVRLHMASEDIADDLEKCRACRWLTAYQEWLNHSGKGEMCHDESD